MEKNRGFTPLVEEGLVPKAFSQKTPFSIFNMFISKFSSTNIGHKNARPSFTTGFTLIELLVVISIIAFVASIVMSNLNLARRRANIAKAKSEVRTLLQVILRYQIDNNSWPSPSNIASLDDWNASWSDPYISAISTDPWGQSYFFDGGASECGWGNTGICSGGPNKSIGSFNNPNMPLGDDICIPMDICK
ncbi:MAG: type II secretion system protein GspG [Candidatus Pacebacteria bacterium]|nr:type II secretion system protein GspG [Candidatus Paceibacterota bacterium]